MNKQIAQTIVGSHRKFEPGNYYEPKGLIYDSFMIWDNELVLVHGSFITITDI